MRVTLHNPARQDLHAVAEVLAAVRGAADTSAALLGHVVPPAIDLETEPWRIGELASEWVRVPDTGSAGVVLYLHGVQDSPLGSAPVVLGVPQAAHLGQHGRPVRQVAVAQGRRCRIAGELGVPVQQQVT